MPARSARGVLKSKWLMFVLMMTVNIVEPAPARPTRLQAVRVPRLILSPAAFWLIHDRPWDGCPRLLGIEVSGAELVQDGIPQ